MKRVLGGIAIILAAGVTLTGCSEDMAKRTVENEKVVINTCDHSGWRVAKSKEIKANRTFFVCGGNKCEVEYNRVAGKKYFKKEIDLPNATTVDIPSRSKNIKFEDCGTVYYRGAK